MGRLYGDELREINRKTRQVYLKRGIYPFLDSNATRDSDSYDCIPGFQIERLYPKIFED